MNTVNNSKIDESMCSSNGQPQPPVQDKDKERQKTQIVETTTKYEGEVYNDKKDGYGQEHNTKYNTIYQGLWQENQYHGEGIFYQKMTDCFFKGKWENNQKKVGIETFPNGDQYEGEYKNGKFHGQGCLHNVTMGFIYDENLKGYNNQYQEKGYFYEGEFQNGMRHGKGVEKYSSGSIYEGEFKFNLKHGKGKLTFADDAYYEGDFLKGFPHGFGIFVAHDRDRSMSLMPILHLDELKKKAQQEIQLISNNQSRLSMNTSNIMTSSTQEFHSEQQQEGEREEYYYEGEFIDGFKHGIGRYFEPDGSYYYCWWEFDKKTQDIVYYNADTNRWCIYEYKDNKNLTLLDYYKPPHEILDKITYRHGFQDRIGFPDNKIDAYKQKIDYCGISGELFTDSDFGISDVMSEQMVLFGLSEEAIKSLPLIQFLRISENDQLKHGQVELFTQPIKPCQLIIQDHSCSDLQLISCLEGLTHYPFLLQKVFTIKYDLETILFFTIKLYLNGVWREIIIDDYLPCSKINRYPIFANAKNFQLGWFVLQKTFCKHYKRYFYWKDNQNKMASEYLQMLTGLPCKSYSWQETEMTSAQTQEKIWKVVRKHPSKVRIAYFNNQYVIKNGYQPNIPIIAVEFIKIDEEIVEFPGYTDFVLLQTLDKDYKIQTKYDQFLWKNNQILKVVLDYISQKEDPNFFMLTVEDFSKYFGEMHILLSDEQMIHNSHHIKYQITDFVNNDNRFFIKFSLNLPTKVLINIEQHQQNEIRGSDQGELFPVRIVLANYTNLFASSKKEHIQKKVLRSFKTTKKKSGDEQSQQEETKKEAENVNLDEYPEDQSILGEGDEQDVDAVNEPKSRTSQQTGKTASQKKVSFTGSKATNNTQKQNKQKEEQKDQQKNPNQTLSKQKTSEEITAHKKKQLPYNYIFGKGQRTSANMFKKTELDTGTYILLVQIEGPDGNDNKSGTLAFINFTVSIFSESLISLQRFEEPENFLRNVYESCIIKAEEDYTKNKKTANQLFTKTDLSTREKGSDDLIITQFYLKKEGSYLQYLMNRSSDKNSKSWRQKLYFRTQNMKILDQNDLNKVDVHLMPGTEELIIIQQIGSKPYNLEGGEGICIIDKITKAGESDDDEPPKEGNAIQNFLNQ